MPNVQHQNATVQILVPLAVVGVACFYRYYHRKVRAANQALELLKQQWTAEQNELKARLVETDSASCLQKQEGEFPQLKFVGGVDISFLKNDPEKAVACVAVLSFPELKVVSSHFKVVTMDQPYIAGFLAFRECSFLQQLLESVRQQNPDAFPQLIFVDGNGKLHHRGFGLACQLGVLENIPTIGIGKNLLLVDGMDKKEQLSRFKRKRETASASDSGPIISPLEGASGSVWGNAVAFNRTVTNPIFVSIGHRISLSTATELAIKSSLYRVPEPVRQADILSRQYVRKHLA